MNRITMIPAILLCLAIVSCAPKSNVDELFGQFQEAYLAKENEKAVQIANSILEIEPENEKTLLALSFLYLRNMNDINKAEEIAGKLLGINPDNQEAYAMLGWVERRKGNRKKSIEYFKRAVTYKSDVTNAYLGLGTALRFDGQDGEAKKALLKHVDIHPDDPSGYSELAWVNMYMGDSERCIENAVIAIKKGSPSVFVLDIGKVLREKGELDNELRLYKAVLKLARSYPLEKAIKEVTSLLSGKIEITP